MRGRLGAKLIAHDRKQRHHFAVPPFVEERARQVCRGAYSDALVARAGGGVDGLPVRAAGVGEAALHGVQVAEVVERLRGGLRIARLLGAIDARTQDALRVRVAPAHHIGVAEAALHRERERRVADALGKRLRSLQRGDRIRAAPEAQLCLGGAHERARLSLCVARGFVCARRGGPVLEGLREIAFAERLHAGLHFHVRRHGLGGLGASRERAGERDQRHP